MAKSQELPYISVVQHHSDGSTTPLPGQYSFIPGVGPNAVDMTAFYQKTGVVIYSDGLRSVASSISPICHLDPTGKLYYYGHPIDELTQNNSFEDVMFLLLCGRLPSSSHESPDHEYQQFLEKLNLNRTVPDSIHLLPSSFPDAHPMEIMAAAYNLIPESEANRSDQPIRNLAIAPTLCAIAIKKACGNSNATITDDPSKGFVDNFLHMLCQATGYDVSGHRDIILKALNVVLITQAEHGSNASTFATEVNSAAHSTLKNCISTGINTLAGLRHGGASQEVLKIFDAIASVDGVTSYIEERISAKKPIMGVGHRVYRGMDPRIAPIKQQMEEIQKILGDDDRSQEIRRRIAIANEVEKQIQGNDYFETRGLSLNVDFYASLLYFMIGLPPEATPAVFATARVTGWVSTHNRVMDSKSGIIRPAQCSHEHARPHHLPSPIGVNGSDKPLLAASQQQSINER